MIGLVVKAAFILICCPSLVYAQHGNEKIDVPKYLIDRLFQLVSEGQIRSSIPDVDSNTNISSKGNYKTIQFIHHVSHRTRTSQKWQIRKNVQSFSVPVIITTALLEAYFYGRAPKPSDDQLLSAAEFCQGFNDVHKPYNNSLVRSFPCHFIDALQICVPTKYGSIDFQLLGESSLDTDIGNHRFVNESVMGKTLLVLKDRLQSQKKSENLNTDLFLELFNNHGFIDNLIPDSDDTFLWLGFGSVLETLSKDFALVRNTWLRYNVNISSAFDALKKYAYRPFSHDPIVNSVDSISYYYLRHFLDDAKAAGKDVALATVWFTNAEEKPKSVRANIRHKVINDVDVMVNVNVVYGITNLILSGLVSPDILEDKDINQIYQNTSSMIAYLINTNFSSRPELALPFYSSIYWCFWATSRIVSVMDIYKRKQDLPVEGMNTVLNELKNAIEGEATRFLTSHVKHDDDGSFYFDDFLGNGDLTEDNKPIIRGEDRIFTTAMAANTLMYTWLSFYSDSGESSWKSGTPNDVKDIVDGCVLWLIKNTLEDKFKPWNALAVSQSKGIDAVAFRYPSNHLIEIPQLYASQYTPNLRVIASVRGYISKIEYEDMINSPQFGTPTPTVFKGFNHPDFSDMVIRSSDSYTYAITLLALSRYRQIRVVS